MSAKLFFTNPNSYLRLIEWVFALIAFATAASLNKNAWGYVESSTAMVSGDAAQQWDGYPSYVGFMIFTGVTGWLLTMIFFGLYGTPKLQNARMLQADLAVSFIWTVFFLAAASAMAAKVDNHCGSLFVVDLSSSGTTCNGTVDQAANSTNCAVSSNSGWCNTYKASVAFGFLSFIFWLISLGIAFIYFRKGPRAAQYQKQDLQMGGFGFGAPAGFGNPNSSAQV